MGRLENAKTKEIVFFNSYHQFGRNTYLCSTTLSDGDVSRTHATIFWSDGYWYIRDHSRNGTFIDGVLISKCCRKIGLNTQIQFGNVNADKWYVLDTKPPTNYLRSLTTKNRILPLDSCCALPNEQQPEIVFYMSENKKWVAESADKKIFLSTGTKFKYRNEEWEFIANEVLTDTLDYDIVFQNACFNICVSANEEDIQLKLVIDNNEYDFGRRAYNYMLLSLCRKRLDDFKEGVTFADQGWVGTSELEKEISKELGFIVDKYYLNLQVFRLRKQIVKMKPYGYLFSEIIERRTGEIRFAFPQLKVIKDNICIGEIEC
ncbi:MAG: FHA domain-containing protein [Flavipsychrobacter sp.]